MTQIVIEFAFGVNHALKRAKAFKVCATYVCNQSTVCIYNLRQFCNFSRVICSRFNHSNGVFCRQSQQGFGHTNVVVKVALCIKHIMLRAQHCCSEFFCSGFTISTSNLYNGCTQLFAVIVCQLLQSAQHIVYHNYLVG